VDGKAAVFEVGNEDIRDIIADPAFAFCWVEKMMMSTRSEQRRVMRCQPDGLLIDWGIYHTQRCRWRYRKQECRRQPPEFGSDERNVREPNQGFGQQLSGGGTIHDEFNGTPREPESGIDGALIPERIMCVLLLTLPVHPTPSPHRQTMACPSKPQMHLISHQM
jgi:hypothetical protein